MAYGVRYSLLLAVRDAIRARVFGSLSADLQARCCEITPLGKPLADNFKEVFVGVVYNNARPAQDARSESRDDYYAAQVVITTRVSDLPYDRIAAPKNNPTGSGEPLLLSTAEAVINAIDRVQAVRVAANTYYGAPSPFLYPFVETLRYAGDAIRPDPVDGSWFGQADPESELEAAQGIVLTVSFDYARTQVTPAEPA